MAEVDVMDVDVPDHPEKKDADSQKAYELPWVEKYRPHLMEDVVGNPDGVQRLQIIAAEGNLPNLLLSGPPGTGKTTSVHCLARALLGAAYKTAVLELNASDDRGIDVVRNKIKMFAQKKAVLPPGRHKIVILDEADSMTQAAQQALRRTMEIYSGTTRFALACNASSKIIEPIQSRCAVVRFTRLQDAEILERLVTVCKAEQVAYVPEGLEAIIFTSDGDMRQAINSLQATVAGFKFVSQDNVFKVCDQPHPMHVKAILDNCRKCNIDEANEGMMALCDLGYSSSDLITTFFRVVRNAEIQEYLKIALLKEVGLCQMRIGEGLNSRLQLSGLLAKLCKAAMQ